MIAALRTGYVQRGRSDCGSASEAGAIVDEDAGGSDALLEAGDTGELGEEVVCRLGGDELCLAEEVTSLGILELLLGWAIEDADGLEGKIEVSGGEGGRRKARTMEKTV